MKIAEITNKTELSDIVQKIKESRPKKPLISDLKKEWYVDQHKVSIAGLDNNFLPDKPIKNTKGEIIDIKKVNRISLPFQKLIVASSVAFGFGNPVTIEHNAEDGTDEFTVLSIIKRILYENKDKILNRKMARELYRSTEVAEMWYYRKTDKPHQDYGFPCNYRIHVKLYQPWNDDILYPVFDDYDKMQAFGRGYTTTIEEKEYEAIEIFTDEEIKRYINRETRWTEDDTVAVDGNVIGKIPVVYGSQELSEWNDVQSEIERLEKLLSRHAEINDYHAAPKTFFSGTITSLPQAGESNGTIQGAPGSDRKVISWNSAPESIKLEIETRIENIHKFTKTPDISFKSIKGLNQISGVMLKMLFMDAHLKVMEKNEIWEDYIQRRFNILKAYVGKLLNTKLDKAANRLEMEPVIKPYMINDVKELVETLMTANGNMPVLSQESSTELADLVPDAKKEFEKISNEADKKAAAEIIQPTNL